MQPVDLGMPQQGQPAEFERDFPPGDYVITLQVEGGGANEETHTTQKVLAVQANRPPAANAGGPYYAMPGEVVQISAAGSADEDGDPLTYSWTVSKAGSQIPLAAFKDVAPTFAINVPGSYALQLTVEDNMGGAATTSTTLQVSYPSPPPPPPPPSPPPPSPPPPPPPPPPPAMMYYQQAALAGMPIASVAGYAGGSYPAGYPVAAASPAGGWTMPPASTVVTRVAPAPPQLQRFSTTAAGAGGNGWGQQVQYGSQQAQYGGQQAQYGAQQAQYGGQQVQYGGQQARYGSQPFGTQPYGTQAYGAEIAAAGGAPGATASPGDGVAAAAPPGAGPRGPAGAQAVTSGYGLGAYHSGLGGVPMSVGSPLSQYQSLSPNSQWSSKMRPAQQGAPGQQGALPGALNAASAKAPGANDISGLLKAATQGAQCTFNKDTGQLVGSGWTALVGAASGATYMAPCPPPPGSGIRAAGAGPLAPAPAPIPPAPVGPRFSAVISSPPALVLTAGGAPARVTLDSAGTTAAALRPVASYEWTVRTRAAGSSTVSTFSGPKATLELPPGAYVAALVVRDPLGIPSTAEREFVVGERAATAATVSSPKDVEPASAAGSPDGSASARVALSAAGSGAGPGFYLASVSWVVRRLPGKEAAAGASGMTAYVTLPVGSYEAEVRVNDSAGGTATATKKFKVGVPNPAALPATVPTATGSGGGSGSGGAGGQPTTAVIDQPAPEVVADEVPGSAEGSPALARVTLDASGSVAATGTTLKNFVWGVVSLPTRTPVASAQGVVTEVDLAPGQYQAGLLITDSTGAIVTAKTTFSVRLVGPKPSPGRPRAPGAAPSATPAASAAPAAGGPGAAGPNRPPAVRQGLSFVGVSGGAFSIAGAAKDADGDPLVLRTMLMGGGGAGLASFEGVGEAVSLEGVPPGEYAMLITADDGRGGVTGGTAAVRVFPGVLAAASAAAEAAGPRPLVPRPRKGEEEEVVDGGTREDGGEDEVVASTPAVAPGQLPRAAGPPQFPGAERLESARVQGEGVVAAAAAAAVPKARVQLPQKPKAVQGRTEERRVGQHQQQQQQQRVYAQDALQLPPLTLPQGAALRVGAASTGLLQLSAPTWRAAAAGGQWELRNLETGEPVATSSGPSARFHLSAPGTFELRLRAPAGGAEGEVVERASEIRVLPRQGWSAGGGFASGACSEPRQAREFAQIALDCSGLSYPGAPPLTFFWRLSSARDGSPAAAAEGAAPKLAPLPAGVYLLELSAHAGGGEPGAGADSIIYYWATALEVAPAGRVALQVPRPACAGRATEVTAPRLELPGGYSVVGYRWIRRWVDGAAAAAASGSAEASDVTGGGSGSSIEWTLQPGRTLVNVTLTVEDGRGSRREVVAAGVVTGAPCVACTDGEVPLAASPDDGRCAAANTTAAAARLLRGPAPPGAALSFAPGALLGAGGERAVEVVAVTPVTRVRATCTAGRVTVRDETPPAVRALEPGGVCAAPGGGSWACWTVGELVSVTDNCQSSGPGGSLAYAVACGESGAAAEDACAALPDGRACVRVGGSGGGGQGGTWRGSFVINVKDGSDNVAEPTTVPVTVHSRAVGGGCKAASISALGPDQ